MPTVAICVLSECLHVIWEMPPDADFSGEWRQIKAGFARHFAASAMRSASKIGKREKGIWQRRFWEHQIRDEQDSMSTTSTTTPVRHGGVSRTTDWPYSNFHRFVRSGDLPLD